MGLDDAAWASIANEPRPSVGTPVRGELQLRHADRDVAPNGAEGHGSRDRAFRLDPLVGQLMAGGFWDQPHPWLPAELLRFPFPGYPDIAGLVAQNRTIHGEAVALGGQRHIIGAVPDMTAPDWRRHFAAQWDAFTRARRRFDPDGVLTPGQGIFPPPSPPGSP